MDIEAAGYLGAVLLAFGFSRPIWLSWCDFRKRYAGMRERAEEYARERRTEEERHDTDPEDRAWVVLG
jgi:hypothetical protein